MLLVCLLIANFLHMDTGEEVGFARRIEALEAGEVAVVDVEGHVHAAELVVPAHWAALCVCVE